MLYGARAADAVLSSRKHNDLLVFEHQAREKNGLRASRVRCLHPLFVTRPMHAPLALQISMLTEYSALIAVPVFVFAGD
jgi:hypothetical protein